MRIFRFCPVGFCCILVGIVFPGVLPAQNWRIGGGNSLPVERLTDVASPDKFTTLQGSLLHLSSKAQEIGWNGIIRYTANIGHDVGWTFFSGVHHFTNSNVLIIDSGKAVPGSIDWGTISQTMIPVGTGLEFRVLNLWFIHGYLAADASYHIFAPRSLYASSTGLQSDGVWLGRGGASVGAGIDVMFWTFGVDLSVRYHLVNLINKAPDEAYRGFLSLNFSLVFGGKW